MRWQTAATGGIQGEHRQTRRVRNLACACLFGFPLLAPATPPDFHVPEGFEVTRFAGDDLAHNIYALTIDSRGDVVVSGPGYVKVLLDENGDGVADRAHMLAELQQTGAHGLCFDGNDLLLTAERALLRFRDTDGDRIVDGPPEIVRAPMNNGEHGAHAVRKGPDGWFYLISGNSPAPGSHATNSPASPVTTPHHGALLRFSPDFKTWEAMADGFRNAYDFDFTRDGRMLTYDSDGERVHYLPGYAPTRIYDIAVGGHHGWMFEGSRRSWSMPLYFPDRVDSVVDIGRGSPTGVLVYGHRQFPARYRDGVFAACWSVGTVYFVPTTPKGSSLEGRLERFLEPVGSGGFAPVGLAVGLAGDLFVAIGGRGTQGGVFRVRFTGENRSQDPPRESGIDQVLLADQPLSSWSRAKWMPLARQIGSSAFSRAAVEKERSPQQRVRAIEILVELFEGLDQPLAKQLAQDTEPAVAARVAWALSRRPSSQATRDLLGRLTSNSNVQVQRAAWEAILALPPSSTLEADWSKGCSSPDRRVRSAAIDAARRHGADTTALTGIAPLLRLATARLDPGEAAARVALDVFRAERSPALRIEALRLLQLCVGDMGFEKVEEEIDTGYVAADLARLSPETRKTIVSEIVSLFPSSDPDVDYEAARLLGMLKVAHPKILPALASFWSKDSSPVDDLHFLLVAIQVPGPRPVDFSRRAAGAMAGLHGKMERRQWLPDRQWPLRVAEIFQRLDKDDPAFVTALIEDPDFGRADHSLYATRMSGQARPHAARKLLRFAEKKTDAGGWNDELIEFVGTALPASEILPRLRLKFDDPRTRDSVALVLASHADPADRARLVEVLETSSRAAVVNNVAQALARMSPESARELAAAIKALGRHGSMPATVLSLDRLLAAWTGQPAKGRANQAAQDLFQPWFAWFSGTYPQEAAGLAEFGGIDMTAWLERLAGVDWISGDAQRGAVVYQQRACAACHDGGRRLGPSLAGVTARFSRNDLFIHILDPNLSISPTYLAQEITMRDGAVHFGVPVYQSAAAVLLEIGPGETIRLPGDQIARSVPARRSPMPEGLLTGITDPELADLYTYLLTLTSSK